MAHISVVQQYEGVVRVRARQDGDAHGEGVTDTGTRILAVAK